MAKPKKKYDDLTRIEKNFLKKKFGVTKLQEIDNAILKSLRDSFKQLKDRRCKNMITYKLWDVVMCVVSASFADNNTWEEIHQFVVDNYEWLRTFLQMTGGIPKPASYERIMGLVSSYELNGILLDFFDTITFQESVETEVYNIDGRVNNGSKRKSTIFSGESSPLNCVNVYSNKKNYCVLTSEIEDKTNEIPTVEKIVKSMNLNNIIVTWDALNTQTKNVEAVIGSKGDYIVPIKGNQGNFYNDLIDYFDEDTCDEIKAGRTDSGYYYFTEKNHSSIIEYEIFQTDDVKWYHKINDWKGVKSFGLVRKKITKQEVIKNNRKNAKRDKITKNVTTIENRYYISSKYTDAKEFYEVTRGHWNVENKLHWHLDFTFCQDKNTTSNKKALLNLEVIHKFVLATLQRVKAYYKRSLKNIRKHLSNNFKEFLPEFICYLSLR